MLARLKDAKARTILAEIILIVVGINVALWFEGKFEDYADAETEQQYLIGLRDDLDIDLKTLDNLIRVHRSKIEKLTTITHAIGDLQHQSDDLQADTIFEPSSYMFFEPSDFTYQSMQESGDFRLLSNVEIKQNIFRLIRIYRTIETLQANFIQAMDYGYIPLLMAKFDLSKGEVTDDSLYVDQSFLNFFLFTLQETDMRADAYEAARDQATKLIRLIEDEIDI
jgi:hypothetical protein